MVWHDVVMYFQVRHGVQIHVEDRISISRDLSRTQAAQVPFLPRTKAVSRFFSILTRFLNLSHVITCTCTCACVVTQKFYNYGSARWSSLLSSFSSSLPRSWLHQKKRNNAVPGCNRWVSSAVPSSRFDNVRSLNSEFSAHLWHSFQCLITDDCCRYLICSFYAAKCLPKPGLIVPGEDNRPLGPGPYPPNVPLDQHRPSLTTQWSGSSILRHIEALFIALNATLLIHTCAKQSV